MPEEDFKESENGSSSIGIQTIERNNFDLEESPPDDQRLDIWDQGSGKINIVHNADAAQCCGGGARPSVDLGSWSMWTALTTSKYFTINRIPAPCAGFVHRD